MAPQPRAWQPLQSPHGPKCPRPSNPPPRAPARPPPPPPHPQEWYGIYNATYPYATALGIVLHPRPAVTRLQQLWANLGHAAPKSLPYTAHNAGEEWLKDVWTEQWSDGGGLHRRLAQPAPEETWFGPPLWATPTLVPELHGGPAPGAGPHVRPRAVPGAALRPAPAPYETVFPTQPQDHLSAAAVLLAFAVPCGAMALCVCLPQASRLCPAKRRDEGAYDSVSDSEWAPPSGAEDVSALSILYRRHSTVEIMALDSPGLYDDVATYVDTLAHFFWIMLSDAAHANYVVNDFVLVYVNDWTERGLGHMPLEELEHRSRLEEVAKAVGGGYCRLQTPLRPALGVRGTVAGDRLGALKGGM